MGDIIRFPNVKLQSEMKLLKNLPEIMPIINGHGISNTKKFSSSEYHESTVSLDGAFILIGFIHLDLIFLESL